MTLNGHCALKSVSGLATDGLASLAFGQNCSKICRATHTLSATEMKPRERSFRQYNLKVYADIRKGSLEMGASNESGVVQNGDFRFFRSLSSEHFTYMAVIWKQLSSRPPLLTDSVLFCLIIFVKCPCNICVKRHFNLCIYNNNNNNNGLHSTI